MKAVSDVEQFPALIGGERRLAASGEEILATNPATGETVGRFPRCADPDVSDAVDAAAAAFPSWRATPATERAGALRRIADLIDAHGDELARLDVIDNGSPIREMRRDVGIASATIRYFAGLALELRGDTIPTTFGRLNYTLQEPYGVVGRIIPFNHPLMFAAGKIAAPLVAGNTIVLKPSEHTSLSALRLAALVADELPPGVLNVVTGYGSEAGEALVAHDGVRRLAFIGSVATGLRIQANAATRTVKTVTLELGGKNPIVVLDDADVDQAIDGVVRGMNFTWQGQSCGSTSRLLVAESLHDEFVDRLAERIESLRLGMPIDEATQTGAIVNEGQLDKVLSYIELGVGEGARIAVGGARAEEAEFADGYFIPPTLFTDVEPNSRLAQEEIFGPVLAVLRVKDYAEALAIANSVSYGLTASIFTQDLAAAHRFARDVEAGYVWVNDSSLHFPGAPYGGVKSSGVGREEGIEELFSYAQPKNVNVNFDSGPTT